MIKSNKMKSIEAKKINELVKSFTDIQVKRIDSIVYDIIDRLIHNSLRMYEESKDFTIVNKQSNEDIVAVSDGLSGELYGENGWIEKYSDYKIQ